MRKAFGSAVKSGANAVNAVAVKGNTKITDPSFEAVCKISADNLHKTKEQISYLKKRHKLETDYIKNLRKLDATVSGAAGGCPEWSYFLTVSESLSVVHERFTENVNTCVVEPLSLHVAKAEAARGKMCMEGQRLLAELQDSSSKVRQVRDDLEKFRKEQEDYNQQMKKMKADPKTKEKDMAKVSQKLENASGKFEVTSDLLEKQEKESSRIQRAFYEDKMVALLKEFHGEVTVHQEKVTAAFVALHETYVERTRQERELVGDFAIMLDEHEEDENAVELVLASFGGQGDVKKISAMSLINASKKGRMRLLKNGDSRFREFFFVFVPEQRSLYYFEHEASQEPRGRVLISEGERVITPVHTSLFDRQHAFCLRAGGASYYMYDTDPASTWFSELQQISLSQDILDMKRQSVGGYSVLSVSLRVSEAKGLKRGEYFAMVQLNGEDVAKTATVVAVDGEAFWGEDFYFDDVPPLKTLTVVVKKAAVGLSGLVKGASVVGPCTQEASQLNPKESWHKLISDGDEEVSLRFSANYTEEEIKAFPEYTRFLEIALGNPALLFDLCEVLPAADRERAAGHLIYVAERTLEGGALGFISALVEQEIKGTDNPNIIFRGNSLATKIIDLFMKLVGMDFLHTMLTDTVAVIAATKASCEVDPLKVPNERDLEANWARLRETAENIWNTITEATERCPPPLRVVFSHIQSTIMAKWPDDDVARYTAVSGFLFLRFIVPAILNPKLFGMLPDHPKSEGARTLTLVAKTLQNLGNLVEFGRKEVFMSPMNPFIAGNLKATRSLIDKYSAQPSSPVSLDMPAFDAARHGEALFQLFNAHQQSLSEVLLGGAGAELLSAMAVLRGEEYDAAHKRLSVLNVGGNPFRGRTLTDNHKRRIVSIQYREDELDAKMQELEGVNDLDDLMKEINLEGGSKVVHACGQCGDPMLESEGVRLMGRVWHPEHLACVACGVSKAEAASNFQEYNLNPYCSACFKKEFCCSYPGCTSTGRADDVVDGSAVCRYHFLESQNLLCGTCDKPILDKCLTVTGVRYHKQCLQCFRCKTTLDAAEVKSAKGHVYCQSCHTKFF